VFDSGVVSVFDESEHFIVDLNTTYDGLVSALDRAGYSRSSTVLRSGDCATRGSVIDFFPKELPFPVRVDFSYSGVDIYRFNVVSQVTIKKIPGVSFVVSLGGVRAVEVSGLLDGLDGLGLDSSVLFFLEGNEIRSSISVCDYSSYVDFNGDVSVSTDLSVCGVFFNKKLFVPPWFLESKPPGVSGEALSVVDGFNDMVVGDYLIHEDYGVGVLSSILSNDSGEDSSLQLGYADAKINISLSQISLLSFFAKAGTPGVSLGSISKKGLWARRKDGVSKKIEAFVASLYKQYLSRTSTTKKRASIDVELLNEFVSSFKFVDTPDQSVAYRDVLADLESPIPMDRLLCGDVGFGKTEIAIRAAFISVLQGERVIILSPTLSIESI
jgi:transcription-repair coupling factor (superfamily II helicase)